MADNIRYEEKLLFPLIVLCNTSAFKNSEVPTMDLEYYNNITFKLSDALISIESNGEEGGLDQKSGMPEIVYNSSYTSEFIHIERFNAYYLTF